MEKVLNQKYKDLLFTIIEEYIETKNPIASEYLVGKNNLNCCSATIRNMMVDLENMGYLYQPYVSSGRIPTPESYRLYIELLDKKQSPHKKIISKIDAFISSAKILDLSQKAKVLAKFYSQISNNAVLLAFSPHNYYATGFSNVLNEPEFSEIEKLKNLSMVFDNLESISEHLYSSVKEIEISIGEVGSLSENLSSIKCRFERGVIAIIGPMRMNYKQNLGLINYFKDKIK